MSMVHHLFPGFYASSSSLVPINNRTCHLLLTAVLGLVSLMGVDQRWELQYIPATELFPFLLRHIRLQESTGTLMWTGLNFPVFKTHTPSLKDVGMLIVQITKYKGHFSGNCECSNSEYGLRKHRCHVRKLSNESALITHTHTHNSISSNISELHSLLESLDKSSLH